MDNHIKAEAHDVMLVDRTGVESLNFPTLCHKPSDPSSDGHQNNTKD